MALNMKYNSTFFESAQRGAEMERYGTREEANFNMPTCILCPSLGRLLLMIHARTRYLVRS